VGGGASGTPGKLCDVAALRLAAGTGRPRLEGAEGGHAAILHPGAQRDPNEPGLEDLLARVEAIRCNGPPKKKGGFRRTRP
jgi:hypothetical protein